MTREMKLWGVNEVLHSTPTLKICRLRIQPGGYCSTHHHEFKDNTFLVEKGVLTIESPGLPSVHLYPGDHYVIPPGRVHRFVNRDTAPAQVLEVESGLGLSDEDINRQDEGGIYGTIG